MKYCPYCGADVLNGSVSFCAECGEALNGTIKGKKAKKEKKRKKADKKPVKEKVIPEVTEETCETEPEPAPDPDFGYAGDASPSTYAPPIKNEDGAFIAPPSVVNPPVDAESRPYVICPKCGEKIWL